MFKFRLTKKRFGLLLLILSLGFGILAYFLKDQIVYLQNLGYMGLFIANLLGSATILLPLPSFATTIAAGAFLILSWPVFSLLRDQQSENLPATMQEEEEKNS
jgi:hypothetical protein